ncbi:MAG TPA: VirB3 family type IV secretion system protein [Gemmatimonadaceae bacterium]|jgi:type IV secretory pathway TrbD component
MTTSSGATSSDSDDRTAHDIHVSLIRPVLIAGAEPTVVILEASMVFALLFVVGFHLGTIAIAAFWIAVVHTTMVWVAKRDPIASMLYVRSLFFRDFYLSAARVHAPTPAPKPSIPALTR